MRDAGHRKGVILVLALVLVAGGCGVSTQDGNSTGQPSGVDPDPGGGPVPVDVPGLTSEQVLRLEATLLAERIGVTVAQAEAMLVLQGELGDLRAALVVEKADTFAGSWIEYDPYVVKFAFTENADEEVDALREQFSRPEVLESVTFSYTLAELRDIASTIWAAGGETVVGLEPLRGKSMVAAVVHERENRVDVITEDVEIAAAIRAAFPSDAVSVRIGSPPTTVLD